MRKFFYMLMLFIVDCKKVANAVNVAKDSEDFDKILLNGGSDVLQGKE